MGRVSSVENPSLWRMGGRAGLGVRARKVEEVNVDDAGVFRA
jgi:hypothetical protein